MGRVILGVTGGVGAGKTTICAGLAQRGWAVLDVDALVRAALGEGGVDRRAVFAAALREPDEYARWAALLRPQLLARIDAWAASLDRPGAIESALLFEEGLAARCTETLCVTCAAPARRLRVEARSTSSAAWFDAIERAQWPERDKAAYADEVLSTDGAIDALPARLEAALDWLALQRRFVDVWRRLGATGDPRGAFRALRARYAEPHRVYHTIAHVRACLRELDALALRPPDADVLELALWYHDAVYAPLASDNEQRSAELAQTDARALGAPGTIGQRVAALVLTTRCHEPGADPLAPFLIDLDLAILGASSAEFARYEAAIRAEYAAVPGPLYAWQRRRILGRLAARRPLYATEALRIRYEAAARVNLGGALAARGR